MKEFLTVLLTLVLVSWSQAQTSTPQIWEDYVDDKANGRTPELADYSFSGYHFSEIPIPSVDSWTKFDVTDFGAVADDELFDDDAIQSTIDAAEAHDGPAVVFFPSGKFMISDDNSTNNFFLISRDSIVIKGSGSGAGGTEIFMKEKRVQNGHWQFLFEPSVSAASGDTFITESASRSDFSIVVDNTSGFTVGETVLLSHKSQEFAEAHFDGLELNESDWTRLFGSGGGMSLHELHEIASINGKRITFVNPIQTDLPLLTLSYKVSHYAVMQEVGVEDILFTSDWVSYPEEFVHHKDDIHDYAWNAIQFKHVKNSWIRNCEFSSWSQVVDVRESIGVTITDVVISGKKGHASFLTRRGYGLLVKDCDDQAGQHHGPGTGYSGVSTVYLRCKMQQDQSIDSHSGQPYTTLLDDVDGGVMDKNGGPFESYPHHGRDLTFWNYRHKSTAEKTYDFWDANNRNGNTYALPNFIGFQPDQLVTFFDEGINQMEGQMVSPLSLFEAQLELRIQASNNPQITFLTPSFGDIIEINSDLIVEVSVSDPDGTVEQVTLYINDIKQRTILEEPYQWGIDELTDPNLFNLAAGEYDLKIEAIDNNDNKTVNSILVFAGQAPEVVFISPSKTAIHESGTSLTVEASANDADGTITSVKLYLNSDLLGEVTSQPYTWNTETLESGVYTLKLEAKDNDDLISTSEQQLIVNDYPTLSFLNPTNGQHFDFESNIKVEVSAADADGAIEEVRLYLNNVLQRKETTAPYIWGERDSFDPSLFDMSDGTYEFRAIAMDDRGSESTASMTVLVDPEVVILGTGHGITKISVFPNPFNQELNLASSHSIIQLQWTDVLGKIHKTVTLESGQHEVQISTKELTKGIYFLRIQSEDFGNKVLKVIKD